MAFTLSIVATIHANVAWTVVLGVLALRGLQRLAQIVEKEPRADRLILEFDQSHQSFDPANLSDSAMLLAIEVFVDDLDPLLGFPVESSSVVTYAFVRVSTPS